MVLPSAGILLFRITDGRVEVLLAHPGGPFWAKRDAGAWSIPKGEFESGEAPVDAARREFEEETGFPVPDGPAIRLGTATQPNGKIVHAWAVEGDLDADGIHSNLFDMEWPPKSGRRQQFPEIDRAAWFGIDVAAAKLRSGQLPLLRELVKALDSRQTA